MTDPSVVVGLDTQQNQDAELAAQLRSVSCCLRSLTGGSPQF